VNYFTIKEIKNKNFLKSIPTIISLSIKISKNVLYKKIGNTFNNKKYLLKRFKEIKDASLGYKLQT